MSDKQYILIVDDESPIREMISFALNSAGFTALHANDAEQVMSLMDGRLPDLILMDWMLPGISGLELSRSLRHFKKTRNIPILILSARAEDEDRLDGFKAGVDDYMTKPFSTKELVERIKALLGSKELS